MRRGWQPTPVFLPGESYAQRSLAGYCPWGWKELDDWSCLIHSQSMWNDARDVGSIPGRIPWRRKWQPTPVISPGKFHGQKNLASYIPWGHKEMDMSEHACTEAGKTHWYLRYLQARLSFLMTLLWLILKHKICSLWLLSSQRTLSESWKVMTGELLGSRLAGLGQCCKDMKIQWGKSLFTKQE